METLEFDTNFLPKITLELPIKDHIILDTEPFCFLCSQELQDPNELTQLSLRNICKFLNVNLTSNEFIQLRKKLLTYNVKKLLQKQPCQFAVFCCSRCARITENLSALVLELETVQLKIQHHLQLVQQVTSVANENLRLNDDLGLATQQMSNRLRSEIKQNCALKLSKMCQPTVPVQNVRLTKTDTVLEINKLLDTFEYPPSPMILTMEIIQVCKQAGTFDSNSIYCPLCQKVVYKIKSHFICKHTDLFFRQDRTPETTEEQFKQYLNEGLNSLFKSFPNRTVTGNVSKVSKCTVCNKTFGYRANPKFHLLICHFKKVREYLQEMQNPKTFKKPSKPFSRPVSAIKFKQNISGSARPDLEQAPLPLDKTADLQPASDLEEGTTSQTTLKPSKSLLATSFELIHNNKYQCTLCSKIVYGGKTRDHIVYYHIQDLFLHKKLPTMTDDDLKNACKKVILNETRASTQVENSNHVRCFHCNETHTNRYVLQYHLLIEHYFKLEVKLEQWLAGKEINYVVENVSKFSYSKEEIVKMLVERPYLYDIPEHIQELCKNGYSDYNCPVCQACLSNSEKLCFHLRTQHPELMFEGVRQQRVKKADFAKICNDVMQANVQKRDNDRFKCNYCTKTFNNGSSLISHLLKMHYVVLRQKVVEAQKVSTDDTQEHVKLVDKIEMLAQSRISKPMSVTQKAANIIFNGVIKSATKKSQIVCQVLGCCTKYPANRSSIALFKRHVGNWHSELLFKNVQSPTIADNQFKDICGNIVNTEANECTVSGFCKYCQQPHFRKNNLKFHMSTAHYDVLKQKIIKAQDNPAVVNCSVKKAKCKRKKRKTVANIVQNFQNEVNLKIERNTGDSNSLPLDEFVDVDAEMNSDAFPIVKHEIDLEYMDIPNEHADEISEPLVFVNGTEIIENSVNDNGTHIKVGTKPEFTSRNEMCNASTVEIKETDRISLTQIRKKPIASIPDFDLD